MKEKKNQRVVSVQLAIKKFYEIRNRLRNPPEYEDPGWDPHITKDEWNEIKKVIRENNLPTNLHAHALGFAFEIYSLPNVDTNETKAKLLWSIDSPKLPRHLIKRNRQGHWDDVRTVRSLFRITHTKKNKALVTKLNLEPLNESPSYYAY